MAKTVLVDTGFLVALLNRRDEHHQWAVAQPPAFPPPWHTCESALSESFHLLGPRGQPAVRALLSRGSLRSFFNFELEREAILKLMEKYADVPMSLADACLVRMSEILPDPILLTTDSDFRIYRRLGRKIVPCVLPV